MDLNRRMRALLAGGLALLLAAGCGARGSVPATAPPASESAPTQPGTGTGVTCSNVTGDDHLARVCGAGVLVVSTDPAYPPQSSLNEDTGEFEGFDIDVAIEIASRMGLEIRFETPLFEDVDGGDWSHRWDVSVGSVTVTEDRKLRLDFTRPYYFTPAQLAAREGSPVRSVADLAGGTICVAEATTYAAWLDGSLQLAAEAGRVTPPPAGVEATSLPTDLDCAVSWRSGVGTFDGWLSSLTTVDAAIDAGYPVEPIGEPVFFEPLAVAFDRSVSDNDSLVTAVDAVVAAMHADGTLSALSRKWYGGQDLTRQR